MILITGIDADEKTIQFIDRTNKLNITNLYELIGRCSSYVSSRYYWIELRFTDDSYSIYGYDYPETPNHFQLHYDQLKPTIHLLIDVTG